MTTRPADPSPHGSSPSLNAPHRAIVVFWRKLALSTFCLAGLCGCLAEDCPNFAPLSSGSVLDQGVYKSAMVETSGLAAPEGRSRSWKLSPSQLQGLSAWLAVRKSGWKEQMPSPLPALGTALLRHADGRISQLSLFTEQASWRTTVQLFSKSADGAVFRGEYDLSRDEFLGLIGQLREGVGGSES